MMTFKEIANSIAFPVYDYTITIVITNDIVRSRNKRSANIGRDIKPRRPQNIGGLHSYKKGEFQAFVFLNPDYDISTISHECYHAISRLFKSIGAKKEEELFAYHLGYLCSEAVKTTQKYKGRR